MRISSTTGYITRLSCYGDRTDLTNCFRLAKEAGFPAMDVMLWDYCFGNGPMTHDGAEQWAEAQRKAADEAGILIRQTHGHTLSGMQWDDPDCPEGRTLIERNLRCIRASKILGAEWMVVHPTNLPHSPLYNAKAAKEANRVYLAPLIEEAKKQGIGLAIENMIDYGRNQRRYCGGDAYELLDLVDTINDPAVGICIDTGHAHQAGLDVPALIRLVGSRLKATHINDNPRKGCEDSHLLPYSGGICWQEVAKALRSIDYHGDFSFELNSTDIPAEAVPAHLHYLCRLGESILQNG